MPNIKGGHKGGRPSKLDATRQEKILSLLRVGNYRETSCLASGVGVTTFMRWMETGAHQKAGKYREFRLAVIKAEAEAEASQVALIRKAAIESWQAAAWLLERKHSEQWGRKDQISGPGGGPVQHQVLAVTMTDEQLLAVIQAKRLGRPRKDLLEEGKGET